MLAIEKAPRRIHKKDGIYYVNNSGLDLIQSCARKAKYVFDQPEKEIKSEALLIGSAVHHALRCFYESNDNSDALFDKMIETLIANADPLVKAIPDGEIGSISNLTLILKEFFRVYQNDKWKIYVDEKGPFVEREFEVEIEPKLRFFGTIDCILQNKETGELCVFDHKTARSLGNQFATKGDVNHQLTGYIFACQKMGIPVTKGAFQGLKKVKTVKSMEVMRVFIQRSPENISEWMEWVYYQVTAWEMMNKTNNFPMNGSHQCNQYSGCQYISVCAAPKAMREHMLKEMNAPLEVEE